MTFNVGQRDVCACRTLTVRGISKEEESNRLASSSVALCVFLVKVGVQLGFSGDCMARAVVVLQSYGVESRCWFEFHPKSYISQVRFVR